MAVQIQIRRGTAALWTSINPVLAQGEQGFETDTKKIKVGDGTTEWNSLAYATWASLSDKDASGGYAGLTLFKINFKNVANTFTSWFTNSNTAARTYTFQDRDGTIADLGANTFAGNQTLGGNKIINPLLEKTLELRASPAIAAGVLALDLANGISAVSLNANITSITFANNAASATVCQSHTLEFTADGTARTVTWPAGDGTTTLLVKWVGGTAPTLTSTNAKRDTFIFKSVGQFLWDAYVVGQNS